MKSVNKTSFNFLVIVFVLLLFCSCTHSNKGPQITSNETTYDYGTIKRYSNGRHVFTIRNQGDSTLVINKVSSSCGCTTVSWTTTPIQPDSCGFVEVNYNTKTLGEFHKTIVVRSNATNTNAYILKIKGKVQ